jgi:hypothetical protein
LIMIKIENQESKYQIIIEFSSHLIF